MIMLCGNGDIVAQKEKKSSKQATYHAKVGTSKCYLETLGWVGNWPTIGSQKFL